MDKIIAKLVRKYFEHLLKNKWMKKIIEIPIDKQKELLKTIHHEINVLISDVLLNIEDDMGLLKEEIENYIESAKDENENENVWKNYHE